MSISDFIKDLDVIQGKIDESATKRDAEGFAKAAEKLLDEGLRDFATELSEFVEELESASANLAEMAGDKDDRPDAINSLADAVEAILGLLQDHM